MATLAHITGMRMAEVTRLRITDIDISRECIIVRNARTRKSRLVPLPQGGAAGVSIARAYERRLS